LISNSLLKLNDEETVGFVAKILRFPEKLLMEIEGEEQFATE
jgi:hypothetical protein